MTKITTTKSRKLEPIKTFYIWWRIPLSQSAKHHAWRMWDKYPSPEKRDLIFNQLVNTDRIEYSKKGG
jgi:hypothetical protein